MYTLTLFCPLEGQTKPILICLHNSAHRSRVDPPAFSIQGAGFAALCPISNLSRGWTMHTRTHRSPSYEQVISVQVTHIGLQDDCIIDCKKNRMDAFKHPS